MTIAELIEELMGYPLDTKVWVDAGNAFETGDITDGIRIDPLWSNPSLDVYILDGIYIGENGKGSKR
jgi:hypothetical protein